MFAKEQQCEQSNNFSREQTHYWWGFFRTWVKGQQRRLVWAAKCWSINVFACGWWKRTERHRDALRIWTRGLVHYPKQGSYKEGNAENTQIHHSEVFVNTFANYSLFFFSLFRFETTCNFFALSKKWFPFVDLNPASSRSPHPVTRPANLTWKDRMNPVFKE